MVELILSVNDKKRLDAGFAAAFGGAAERYFSAPGRTEVSGNHTDHQRGRVLAGAVNLDTVAAVRRDTVFLEKIQTTEKTPARVNFLANWMPWILIFFLSSLLLFILFNGLRR